MNSLEKQRLKVIMTFKETTDENIKLIEEQIQKETDPESKEQLQNLLEEEKENYIFIEQQMRYLENTEKQ